MSLNMSVTVPSGAAWDERSGRLESTELATAWMEPYATTPWSRIFAARA